MCRLNVLLIVVASTGLAVGCGSIEVSSGTTPGGCGDGVCGSVET